MRSYHELVYKLAICPLFCHMDVFTGNRRQLQLDSDAEYGSAIFARSIQAIILELIALELAALMSLGHIEGPKSFVVALLSTGDEKGECWE